MTYIIVVPFTNVANSYSVQFSILHFASNLNFSHLKLIRKKGKVPRKHRLQGVINSLSVIKKGSIMVTANSILNVKA